eukprot:CAMPEP_0201878932 /NCGR_PEP_ID=MMETSP0902-20130614/9959_1 /ASSEMBLY_ACC=CAM_ASM_000551 /TAXON_ID=420261 /ORGANISM="Thalassiosira antarctica, Strain CCMP982" /LENGTH=395 /DNA_ID=CAMNT_0048406657 /DNA_START=171 /DNA_END=1357 /DNA_ORIENTATION=-
MFGRFILSFAVAVGAISSANAQLIPAGSVDIGTVTTADSSVQTADGWAVSGSGSDIWGTWDQFHYLHFNRTADVTVTCLVNDFTGSDEAWRKGGIMFRNNIGEGRSAHSMIQVTGWGVSHQSRLNDNSYTVSVHDNYPVSNIWLRLVKEDSTITSFIKRDGEFDFMQYHSVEVEFVDSFSVGIAVTSHDNNVLATLDVSHLEISDVVYSSSSSPTEIGDTGDSVIVQQVREGVWSVKAAGTDIGGNADSFGFFDTERSGDVTATLHLEKLVRRNNDSKGGLMMRASHAVDAPHVSLLVTAKDGITMFSRATIGGDTVSKNVGVWHEDMELRLVKTGNSVECAYKHSSAPDWYVIGTATAELDSAAVFHVGQAVSSADHGQHSQLTSGVVDVQPAL